MNAFNEIKKIMPELDSPEIRFQIDDKNQVTSICEDAGYFVKENETVIRRTTTQEFLKIPNALWKILGNEKQQRFVTPWDIIPSFTGADTCSDIFEAKPFVLAQPFKHSTWLRNVECNKREAVEYFASTNNYRMKSSPNETGLTTLQYKGNLSTYRLQTEEAWYYKERHSFYMSYLKEHPKEELYRLPEIAALYDRFFDREKTLW